MRNYRIVKLTLNNNKEVYVIQKQTRFFWIGPKIWETYQKLYDGNYCSYIGWTWFITWGDYFDSLETAKKELNKIKQHYAYISKYKYKQIVYDSSIQ